MGSKQDTVYAGLENFGMACVRVQVTGGRLLIMADAMELAAHYKTNNLADIITNFKSMTAASMPDAVAVPSLVAGYTKTGDIIYTPMGVVTMEKTINDLAVSIRTALPFTPRCCIPGFRLVARQIGDALASKLLLAMLPEPISSRRPIDKVDLWKDDQSEDDEDKEADLRRGASEDEEETQKGCFNGLEDGAGGNVASPVDSSQKPAGQERSASPADMELAPGKSVVTGVDGEKVDDGLAVPADPSCKAPVVQEVEDRSQLPEVPAAVRAQSPSAHDGAGKPAATNSSTPVEMELTPARSIVLLAEGEASADADVEAESTPGRLDAKALSALQVPPFPLATLQPSAPLATSKAAFALEPSQVVTSSPEEPLEDMSKAMEELMKIQMAKDAIEKNSKLSSPVRKAVLDHADAKAKAIANATVASETKKGIEEKESAKPGKPASSPKAAPKKNPRFEIESSSGRTTRSRKA